VLVHECTMRRILQAPHSKSDSKAAPESCASRLHRDPRHHRCRHQRHSTADTQALGHIRGASSPLPLLDRIVMRRARRRWPKAGVIPHQPCPPSSPAVSSTVDMNSERTPFRFGKFSETITSFNLPLSSISRILNMQETAGKEEGRFVITKEEKKKRLHTGTCTACLVCCSYLVCGHESLGA